MTDKRMISSPTSSVTHSSDILVEDASGPVEKCNHSVGTSQQSGTASRVQFASPAISFTYGCDCSLRGGPVPMKICGHNIEPTGGRLRQLTQTTRETQQQLAQATDQLLDMRHQAAVYQRILSLELGLEDSRMRNQALLPKWKGRIYESSYLKAEKIRLVDYLRDCDPEFRRDPSCDPIDLDAGREELLTERQKRVLQRLYKDRTVFHSENESSAAFCLARMEEMKEDYMNKLLQNRVMVDQVKALRKKVKAFQERAKEDKELIEGIMRELPELRKRECPTEGVCPLPVPRRTSSLAKKSEAEKYRKLWEGNVKEKKRIQDTIKSLETRLEDVSQLVIKAEHICSSNILLCRDARQKMRQQIRMVKRSPRKRGTTFQFEKFSTLRFRSTHNQLQAAIGENVFLRQFLKKAILSKTEDFEQLRNSLMSTAEKYRKILEEVRGGDSARKKED